MLVIEGSIPNEAIKEEGYRGDYRGVFPIKVNQLREVVDEIVAAGKDYNYGLEAGSKPELMIALVDDANRHVPHELRDG